MCIRDRRRYTEAELMAALVQSFFTAWIKTQSDPSDIPINETGAGDVVGFPGEEIDNLSESDDEYELSLIHISL